MKKKTSVVAVGLAVAALAAGTVHAGTPVWNANSGRWDVAANWSQGTVPAVGDTVTLTGRSNTPRFVEFRGGSLQTGALAALYLDAPSTAPIELRQFDSRFATDVEIVGRNGVGAVTVYGGTHIVQRALTLGEEAGSAGDYAMFAGALSAQDAHIGLRGAGTFQQHGGEHTVSGTLAIGGTAGGEGTYAMSDTASLQAVTLNLGTGGRGTFRQDGGSVKVTRQLNLGADQGTADYVLSTGSLSAGSLTVGMGSGNYADRSVSTFRQQGGTVAVANALTIGQNAVFGATYVLDQGTLSAGSVSVGLGGSGELRQNGGTVTVADGLSLGGFRGFTGSYDMQGGSLAVGTLQVGVGGTANMTQAGGAVRASGAAAIGAGYGSIGRYTLSGGTFEAGSLAVGVNGTGELAQTGAYVNVTGLLSIAEAWAGTGSYTLSGNGQLKAAGIELGLGGAATFTQFSGSVTSKNQMSLGANAGTADYYLYGGSVTAGSLVVGAGNGNIFDRSSGTWHQNGGNVQVGGALTVGLQYVSNGTYVLEGGTVTARNAQVGLDGRGAVRQQGGTMTVAGDLAIASYRGAYGTYALDGGTLSAQRLVVGVAGDGTFVQAGGAVALSDGLLVAATPGSTGSYSLQGGTLTAGAIGVGAGGYLVGAAGTEWHVATSFANGSSRMTEWNTGASSLVFDGAGTKTLALGGSDRGFGAAGYAANFAFGTLSLAYGAQLDVVDGNDEAGAALYVGLLQLGGGLAQLSDIHSPFNIYYDATLTGNAWLHGGRYALDGGGWLQAAAPVPEPAGWALLLGGLGVTGLLARRRRRG